MKRAFVKVFAATGAVAAFGAAVLPLTSYAATTANTTVTATVGAECALGDSPATGSAAINVNVSLTTPAAIQAGGTALGVKCNQAWDLTEYADHVDLKRENVGTPGLFDGATGFSNLASSVAAGTPPALADLSTWANNRWGMAYTNGTGTTLTSAGLAWHTPTVSGSAVTIATGSATGGVTINQYLGAKTDGSVAAGKYGAIVTYTLTPQ